MSDDIKVRFIRDSVKYESTIVTYEVDNDDVNGGIHTIEIIECDDVVVDGVDIKYGSEQWVDLNQMILTWHEHNH